MGGFVGLFYWSWVDGSLWRGLCEVHTVWFHPERFDNGLPLVGPAPCNWGRSFPGAGPVWIFRDRFFFSVRLVKQTTSKTVLRK